MGNVFQDGEIVWVNDLDKNTSRAAQVTCDPAFMWNAWNGERCIPQHTTPIEIGGVTLAGADAEFSPYPMMTLEWIDTGKVDFVLIEGWQGVEFPLLFERIGTDIFGEAIIDLTGPVGEPVFLTRQYHTRQIK